MLTRKKADDGWLSSVHFLLTVLCSDQVDWVLVSSKEILQSITLLLSLFF